MTKIFCWTANLNDGASTPRVNSIKHLEETGYPVQVQVGTGIRDFELWWADIVMLHRTITPEHLEVVKKAKLLGKKVWVDVDDDQLAVPIDHPGYMFYKSEVTQHSIRESCRLADVVTISNPQIKESYGMLNKNIVYYPCAYDERLMPEPDYSPREKVIMWRGGSSSHNKSIAEFAPAIGELDRQFKGWKFVFVGDYPWQWLEQIKNNTWEVQPFLPPQALWNYGRELKAAIQMVCLTDNQFTRSRSNMSAMDGTIMGAVTVARDYPHFKETPGVLTYKDTEDFTEIMREIMSDGYHTGAAKYARKAWTYIQSRQTFKAINVKQMEVINEISSN